jgi:hypothetical protein
VADPGRFHAAAPHAFRPHEIFAEDFRVLFGGPLARQDGAIENGEIARPERILGLRDRYLALVGSGLAAARDGWRLWPNPAHRGQALMLRAPAGWAGQAGPRGTVLDASGRRVAGATVHPAGGGSWRVLLEEGAPRSGVLWLRLDGGVPPIPIRLVP